MPANRQVANAISTIAQFVNDQSVWCNQDWGASQHRLARRLELVHTPKHGSWLNMAEIELSALSRQRLNRRITDLVTLAHEVTAWAQERNQHATTVQWHFTTADAHPKFLP